MEFELSGIFQVKLVAKNIKTWRLGPGEAINMYIFRDTTSEMEGGRSSLPFSKNSKKPTDFGKNAFIVFVYGLNLSFKMLFCEYLEDTHKTESLRESSLPGPFFHLL